jgi:hypothetical protein
MEQATTQFDVAQKKSRAKIVRFQPSARAAQSRVGFDDAFKHKENCWHSEAQGIDESSEHL